MGNIATESKQSGYRKSGVSCGFERPHYAAFAAAWTAQFQLGDQPDELARDWFSDPNVKKQIADLLREFELDESAIEAEAIRQSTDDLERIDRLMASAEARRDKALVCVAQYRGDFGALLRDSSDRLIKKEAPRLEHDSSKRRSAA